MTNTAFRLMGLQPSPYTKKVESYFKFKNMEYQWLSRSFANEKLFAKHANVALIPLLFFPSGETLQDSTTIIERLEKENPTPSIHPDDPGLWFVSCLFEEFGDEWCNKLMFFQRWFYAADAKATSKRLADELLDGKWWAGIAKPVFQKLIVRRMVPRLSYSGGTKQNIPQLKASFENLSALLNVHFEQRSYLLGERPCFGDFGLWCNLYQAWTDPTANTYLEEHAPALVAYLKRMLSPSIEGELETLDTLEPTLAPIIEQEVAGRFLPWMKANHQAFEAGDSETKLSINGEVFEQKTFKFQAKTLDELGRKYQSVANNHTLNELLQSTGCYEFFAKP